MVSRVGAKLVGGEGYTQIDYAYSTTYQPSQRCNIHLHIPLPRYVHQFSVFHQYVYDFPILNQKYRLRRLSLVERSLQCLIVNLYGDSGERFYQLILYRAR